VKPKIIFLTLLLASLAMPPLAHAATYYYGPSGSSSAACTQAAPCALDYNLSGKTFQPGDTIYLLGGTYSGGYIRNGASGNSGAWITFKAVDGQLPILDGGGGVGCGVEPNASVQYVIFDGIASRNWQSSGFSNGWNTPSSHIQFINCIADGNGVNGIAFYKATGVLIQQSIVAHNGNQQPSWSSGVNLYTAGGSYQDNIIRRNVSFENIDISSHHSDGSGFILDQSSTGALFENNIGFRNGGSCIRLNCPGSHVVNNTCYHDGLEPSDAQGLPASPGEIYYSNPTAESGAVFQNNLAAASGYNNSQTAFGGQVPTQTTNYAVNANAAAPFFVDPAGANPNFHLTSSATANIVDKGTASGAPTQDIGFDAKCIKSGSPGGASWWSYTIDYTYIAGIGGVAKCFNPATRSSSPDIGAYEYNGTSGMGGAPGTGGTTSTGGSTATGGTTASGGTTAAGGAKATGGALASGGTTAAGGSTAMGGTTSGTSGGSKATGGTFTGGGGIQAAGGVPGTGGSAVVASGGLAGGSKAAGGMTGTVPSTGGASTSGATVAGGSNASGGLGTGGLLGSGGIGANPSGGVAVAAGGTSASTGGSTGGVAGGAANAGGDMGGSGAAGSSGARTTGDVDGCSCRVANGSSHSTLAGLGLLGLIVLGFTRRSSARSAIRGGDRAALSNLDNAGRNAADQT
jgi:MYXO-CTERM domain-containing protein